MAFGLRLARSQGPEGTTGNLDEHPINPANASPIFFGDPVRFDTNGWVVEASGGGDSDDFNIAGVFRGCRYVDANGDYAFSPIWDGGAGRATAFAHVQFPTNGVFHIMGDAAGTYTRANTVGKRFGVTYTAGNLATSNSGVALGAAAAATGPLLVLGLARFPNQRFDMVSPTFEVIIVRPQAHLQVA